MGAIIGIDLGTTNSCAAIVKEGKPRVISDTGGGFTIPSIVAMDDKGNRLVGQSAKRQSLINPLNTIYGAKRLIGRRYSSKVMDNIKKNLAYDMSAGDNEDVLIKMAGEVYGLDEVSALILDKVRNTAQEILQEEITHAVVTVPAYFNDRQRQAVKDAGRVAEIEVLRIINEPTAAALAYGWGKQLQERVVVYDLGGGTFDISLLEVRDNVYEVKATGGDTFLGGVDFDNRLMDYVLQRFHEETKVDVTGDPLALQRIKDAGERCKIDLSTKQETRLNIPFIAMGDAGPVNLDMTITREQFESIVTDLVTRTLEKCEEVLKDANWTTDDVQDVLLVGGQTRMPYVQQKVAEFFGKTPSKGVHPDEAVAIGAAIMAYSMSENADYKITLLDVIPISVGVMLANDRFHRIFPRNTSIPNETSMIFTTSKENQSQLKLKILQGENDKASENELLGDFVFLGIPPAPKGHAKLEVIFKLSPEGMLAVEAQDPETKKWINTTLTISSGISQKTHHTKLIERKHLESSGKEKTEPQSAPPASKRAPKPVVQTTVRIVPKPPPARDAAPYRKLGKILTGDDSSETAQKPDDAAPPKITDSEPTPIFQTYVSADKTPPPSQSAPFDKTPPPGLGLKTSAAGRVLIKRDPLTGMIIKDAATDMDSTTPSQESPQKPQFKRRLPPPKPPSFGEKIGGLFKGLFGKK